MRGLERVVEIIGQATTWRCVVSVAVYEDVITVEVYMRLLIRSR